MKTSENFEENPVSQSAQVLCKCLATVSCKLEKPRFLMLHVAPSRQYKSHSSNKFEKEF